jgi:dolichol-phosphate mannosyltransferase
MRLIRLVAAGAALSSIARAAPRLPPLRAGDADGISVVIPARNEEARLGPLLDALIGAPGVVEVVVVDDQSTDGTAALAGRHGARVVTGARLPDGWVGKAWALQQGLQAATGEWVVFLDADTRPAPELPAALVARIVADGLDVLTVAGRFDCPTAGVRWLHPALLTTLVYRCAPPGASRPGPVHRRMGNGQCVATRRSTLLAAGGWRAVAHHTVEDVALVRAMATAGFAVAFLDAGELLTVRMYETAPEAWRGWGRSLSLPGVEPVFRRVAGVGVVTLAQAAPLLRLLARRGDALDVALLAVRIGTLAGTARAYRRRGLAYWLSPTADLVAAAALAVTPSANGRWRSETR